MWGTSVAYQAALAKAQSRAAQACDYTHTERRFAIRRFDDRPIRVSASYSNQPASVSIKNMLRYHVNDMNAWQPGEQANVPL